MEKLTDDLIKLDINNKDDFILEKYYEKMEILIKNNFGTTPLHIVSNYDYFNIVKFLIENYFLTI